VATLAAAASQAWNAYSGVCAFAAIMIDENASATKASATDPSPMVMVLRATVDDSISRRRCMQRARMRSSRRSRTMLQRGERGFDADQMAAVL
jgi:hypothetical protein